MYSDLARPQFHITFRTKREKLSLHIVIVLLQCTRILGHPLHSLSSSATMMAVLLGALSLTTSTWTVWGLVWAALAYR